MSELLPGVTIAMGRRDWVVPALTLGQLLLLEPDLDQIGEGESMKSAPVARAVIKIVTAALSRNYPNITAAEVGDNLLDMGNANAVLHAVLTGSGLKQRLAANGMGEAVAAAGNGGSSMAPSPPPSVGLTSTSTD